MTKQKSRGVHASLLFCASMKAFPFEGKVALRVREDPKRRMRCLKVFRVSATSSVSYADSCLAAARANRRLSRKIAWALPVCPKNGDERRFSKDLPSPDEAAALTCHRHVIHSRVVASLPSRGSLSQRRRFACLKGEGVRCAFGARYAAPRRDIRLRRAIYGYAARYTRPCRVRIKARRRASRFD